MTVYHHIHFHTRLSREFSFPYGSRAKDFAEHAFARVCEPMHMISHLLLILIMSPTIAGMLGGGNGQGPPEDDDAHMDKWRGRKTTSESRAVRGRTEKGGPNGQEPTTEESEDISSLTSSFQRVEVSQRSNRQQEIDRSRRLRTQCNYEGWFPKDEWDDPQLCTHRNRVFRQCRNSASVDHAPRCNTHRDVQNGDINDPSETQPPDQKKKEKKKKGLQPDQC